MIPKDFSTLSKQLLDYMLMSQNFFFYDSHSHSQAKNRVRWRKVLWKVILHEGKCNLPHWLRSVLRLGEIFPPCWRISRAHRCTDLDEQRRKFILQPFEDKESITEAKSYHLSHIHCEQVQSHNNFTTELWAKNFLSFYISISYCMWFEEKKGEKEAKMFFILFR